MSRDVDYVEVVHLREHSAMLAEVLLRREYDEGRICGEVRIPLTHVTNDAMAGIPHDYALLIYDYDRDRR